MWESSGGVAAGKLLHRHVFCSLCPSANRGLVAEWVVRAKALLGGVWANLFVLPAFAALALGILGLPSTWWTLLKSFYNLGPADGSVVEKLAFMAGQVFQMLIFRPFACPPSLQGLPAIVKLFLFREPERLIAPPAAQLRQAPVKDEYWIFANGISTTTAIAQSNADMLFKLFGYYLWRSYRCTRWRPNGITEYRRNAWHQSAHA